MLARVLDRKAIVRIENLRRITFEQHGWVRVTEGAKGPRAYPCSCHAPCGYRAFPGVARLRNLQWSDILKCWKRALRSARVLPNGPDSIEVWIKHIDDLKRKNRAYREKGLVTKSTPVMLLASIPGVILRALEHDYPHEFSSTVGARSEDIEKHLEKVLADFFVAFEHGRHIGSCLPRGTNGTVLDV